MPNDLNFWEAVRRIRAADDRYEPDVYPFVMEALEYTIQGIGERRHVRAEELLEGFSAYARWRFGLLAGEVLAKWGVRHAFDVGLVVFQMVEAGVLARQESDRLEDFDQGFDLESALQDHYFD